MFVVAVLPLMLGENNCTLPRLLDPVKSRSTASQETGLWSAQGKGPITREVSILFHVSDIEYNENTWCQEMIHPLREDMGNTSRKCVVIIKTTHNTFQLGTKLRFFGVLL